MMFEIVADGQDFGWFESKQEALRIVAYLSSLDFTRVEMKELSEWETKERN